VHWLRSEVDSGSDNDAWIGGDRVAARKDIGSALLARMIFDKERIVRKREEEREGYMIPVTHG
jgi:hypothetical protein